MGELHEHRDAIQAQNLALLALNDLLIDCGLVPENAWADQLRRFKAPGGRVGLQSVVNAIIDGLEARHFRVRAHESPVRVTWDEAALEAKE